MTSPENRRKWRGFSRSFHSRERSMKNLRLAGLVFAASMALAGTAFAQDTITIGVAGPMTGQYASFGQQLKNGADMALADINAAGGVMGKKLAIEIGDDACDPKQARAVGEKFAGMHVPFVAGHYCSSSSIPASEAYAEGNVLQITPASTNPTFTERGLWNTFRVCGRDDQQGAVAGNFIARNYKGETIATNEFRSITGPAGEGMLFTFGHDPRKKPTAAAVVKKFKDKGIDPEGYTLYTYAAIQEWVEAVKKAGSTDAKKVAATLKAGTWDTVLGKISYDPKGDIKIVDYVVYKWNKDGNYTELSGPPS